MKRGMTLIEILVGLFIFGLIVTLVVGFTSTLVRLSSNADDISKTYHMGRVAIERISRDIAHAYLSLNQSPDESTKTLFVGERDRLMFTYMGNIPVHAGANETDQGVVEYKLSRNRDSRNAYTLIRRFKPHIDDTPESGGTEYSMAVHIKTLEFEYFNPDDQGGDWESDWTADDPLSNLEPGFKLPPRVKIRLQIVDKNNKTHTFETQSEIHIQKPLLFGKATSAKAQQFQNKEKLKKMLKTGQPIAPGLPAISPSATTGGTGR